jgi:predicted extracellular nuclease
LREQNKEPDATVDADPATSEGTFVFTSAASSVNVGDELSITGTVAEFRPGGVSSSNLSTTEITGPTIVVQSSGNALPAPIVIGTGGRIPPVMVIEDDATGDVETSGVFDPAYDGIDFYESLEAMRSRSSATTEPTPASARPGAGSLSDRTTSTRSGSFSTTRSFRRRSSTSATFEGAAVGVLDYSFANYKLDITQPLTRVGGGLAREVTQAPRDQEIAVATYNVENLDPSDATAVFARHADYIVNHLRSPDLLANEEIQDNDGAANTSVVDASQTWNMLIAAVAAAGGPAYQYRQIDPVDDADGGEPGGNIRVGFLFRTDRELEFVDRPGGLDDGDLRGRDSLRPASLFRPGPSQNRIRTAVVPGIVNVTWPFVSTGLPVATSRWAESNCHIVPVPDVSRAERFASTV